MNRKSKRCAQWIKNWNLDHFVNKKIIPNHSVWLSWLIAFPNLAIENGYVRRWQEKLLLSGDPGDWSQVLQDFRGHWEGKCHNMCALVRAHAFEGAAICAFLSRHKQCHIRVSFCHFFVVGVSQHENVSYWQILWLAQMSQELIDSVIIGSALGLYV